MSKNSSEEGALLVEISRNSSKMGALLVESPSLACARFRNPDFRVVIIGEVIFYVNGRWPRDVYDCVSVWPGDVDYRNGIYGLGICMIV
jgi:hypothetical protein